MFKFSRFFQSFIIEFTVYVRLCCVSSGAFQHCTDLNIIGGSEDRIVWDGSSFTQNAAAVDASLIKGLGF